MKIVFLFLISIFHLFAVVESDGIVYSKNETKLSFQIDGILSQISVKEGEKINKNDLILKLDDTLQSLEVQRRKEILLDNAEYNSNVKNLEVIQSLLLTTKKLYDKTASVSKDELSNLQIQEESLKGKVAAYKSKKIQEDVEYKIAKEVLNKYRLVSPINGIVTNLKYQEGEWVKTGDIVVTVVDTDNCYVDLNLEEPIARTLKLNSEVLITTNNKTISKKGEISYIAPSAEATSALVKVRVSFINAEPKITPGVLSKVTFDGNKR